MLVRDPTAANELPLRTFRDEYVAGKVREDGTPILGRSAESAAAGFWLEHRTRREHSITDLDPKWRQPGRAIPTFDVEATVQTIANASQVIPPSWRAVVMVACGWSLSVSRLQERAPADGGPPYLERAGFAFAFPQGFGGRAIDHWQRQLRDRLVRLGLVEDAPMVEDGPASPRAVVFVDQHEGEVPLVGWVEICAHLGGIAENTARAWRDDLGMPVMQAGPGRLVQAYRTAIDAWRMRTFGAPLRQIAGD